MGQQVIWNYLKQNKDRLDITVKEIMINCDMTQGCVNRVIKSFAKHNEIIIVVDGRKHLIRYLDKWRRKNGINKR